MSDPLLLPPRVVACRGSEESQRVFVGVVSSMSLFLHVTLSFVLLVIPAQGRCTRHAPGTPYAIEKSTLIKASLREVPTPGGSQVFSFIQCLIENFPGCHPRWLPYWE